MSLFTESLEYTKYLESKLENVLQAYTKCLSEKKKLLEKVKLKNNIAQTLRAERKKLKKATSGRVNYYYKNSKLKK